MRDGDCILVDVESYIVCFVNSVIVCCFVNVLPRLTCGSAPSGLARELRDSGNITTLSIIGCLTNLISHII